MSMVTGGGSFAVQRLDADDRPTPQPPAWMASLRTHAVNEV
jgi:hypothetical protein